MPKTKGAKEIDQFTRGRIVGRWECGETKYKIAKDIGVSVGSVYNIITNFQRTGTCSTEKRTGRPRKITRKVRRAIVHNLRANPQTTLRELSFKTKVGQRTLSKELHKMGFRKRFARRKPLLSETNVTKRFAWANSFHNSTLEFWRDVVFTDESRFQQFATGKRLSVWRKDGEALKFVQPTVKFGGVSLMVWGAIWYSGRSELVFIEGRVSSDEYINVLSENLLPLFDSGVLDRDKNILQEDGATCHTSQSTRNWKAMKGLKILPWAPQSPDMNPIEHVWEHVERELRKVRPYPRKKDGLMSCLSKIWNDMDQSVIQNLIDSMPSRVWALVVAEGKVTKY